LICFSSKVDMLILHSKTDLKDPCITFFCLIASIFSDYKKYDIVTKIIVCDIKY